MGHSKNSHDIQQCLTASGYIKVFPFGGRVGCRDQCEHRDVSSLGDSAPLSRQRQSVKKVGAMLKGKATPYFL